MVETSLYFHIPFCHRKCPYCHFYVIPHKLEWQEALFQAFHQELDLLRPLLSSHRIVSVYFGGGTPSLVSASSYAPLLERLSLASDCEITLEANPEDVTLERMQQYRQIGINRISIGVQSLDDSALEILERRHSAEAAKRAVVTTFDAGIENISIDLMFELPLQTLGSWSRTLEEAVLLPITHGSLYNLTIEPHTSFYKKRRTLTLPENGAQMIQEAVSVFARTGFVRYEISAFAKKGYESQHNIGYWEGRSFFGLGPSAWSYSCGRRSQNHPHLHKYLRAIHEGRFATDYEETLSPEKMANELLAIGLRMCKGVSLTNLPEKTLQTLRHLHSEGLIYLEESHVRLTERGLLFHDDIAAEIV